MRNRSVTFVIRNNKILMEKICFEERSFYNIPGGGIEEGETPEMTAIRELKEECGLDGIIVKKLCEVYSQDRTEHSFLVKVSDDQIPTLGFDPEDPIDKQSIKEVRFMGLDEISEKDRSVLFQYGLLQIDGFWDEVVSWENNISYSKK